jgi:hypothetical protein
MADEYQIASGHDNAGSLVDITTIVPSNDVAFFPPKAWPAYSEGRVIPRSDGSFAHTGFIRTQWKFDALTNEQYNYLYDNYFMDATNQNKVTIRTRSRSGYANYNARIKMPDRANLRVDKGHPNLYYLDVEIDFIRLEAL